MHGIAIYVDALESSSSKLSIIIIKPSLFSLLTNKALPNNLVSEGDSPVGQSLAFVCVGQCVYYTAIVLGDVYTQAHAVCTYSSMYIYYAHATSSII